MKAIILAGGLGTRLGKYTKNLPKCMLEFAGKSLLERQIETYKRCGIEDIIVIRKHLADKINLPNIRYIDETDYDTHMVVGFFQARREFDDDVIMSYGDIIFEPDVLYAAIQNDSDVGIVADTAWKDYWTNRMGNWTEDSESFVIGEKDRIVSLGVSNPPEKEMDARYVGIIKFSKAAWPKIEEVYDEAKANFWDKQWHQSKSFKKAYMTDFMQALIDSGIDVKAVKIQRGWLEFDTERDYELICEWAEQGSLDRFYKLEG